MVSMVKKLAKQEHSANEAMHVEQGQLVRAAESDQCVLKVKTQRQRDTVEFTHSLLGVNRKAAWKSDVCSLKGQNETAEITLLSTVATTRRVKTIPRNTSRYSHDSLGHFESVAKEVEKQMRVFISHTWRADHQCNSDRNVARTTTQGSVNAEEQTSLFKWKDAHWVQKLKRADEHLLVIRELTRLARAGRGQARAEKWNLGSDKAVLNRIQELKASTELHTSAVRQKYITNRVLDKQGRPPLSIKCTLDAETYSSKCRERFETIGTKEIAEAELPSCIDDSIQSKPEVGKQK